MTTQEQFKSTLERIGVPAKEIKCYGSQVMITCWSRSAAMTYHGILKRCCSVVRWPKESIDYNKVNENTCLLPSQHKVWRVWGTI